ITDLLASEREREQFLSIVSHELRTPLTPLKALAQLVRSRMRRSKEKGTELDMESLDHNLAAIERQVDRMNGLVNDLLSVSRAEPDGLQPSRGWAWACTSRASSPKRMPGRWRWRATGMERERPYA